MLFTTGNARCPPELLTIYTRGVLTYKCGVRHRNIHLIFVLFYCGADPDAVRSSERTQVRPIRPLLVSHLLLNQNRTPHPLTSATSTDDYTWITECKRFPRASFSNIFNRIYLRYVAERRTFNTLETFATPNKRRIPVSPIV